MNILEAIMFVFIGFVVAMLLSIAINMPDYTISPDCNNGWLSRPVKHFKCGAFHGHHWVQGIDHKRCTRCGKIKRCPHMTGEEVEK